MLVREVNDYATWKSLMMRGLTDAQFAARRDRVIDALCAMRDDWVWMSEGHWFPKIRKRYRYVPKPRSYHSHEGAELHIPTPEDHDWLYEEGLNLGGWRFRQAYILGRH
jgi:hypothetical protein